jgi:hypothetical protein
MLGYRGPAQPSPALGDALNAGYMYLEVRCLGCDTHQTVALNIVRRPKATPVHELERYMRCKDCSQVRSYPYKRSHLVALRQTKISASDPPSTCSTAIGFCGALGSRLDLVPGITENGGTPTKISPVRDGSAKQKNARKACSPRTMVGCQCKAA